MVSWRGVANSRRVRTERIPIEELKRVMFWMPAPPFPGPNRKNSDRGIETTSLDPGPTVNQRVRTERIPIEELKLSARVN